MKIIPLFENDFYHDGRGPELQRVILDDRGVFIRGFEYFNPTDKYIEENIKHIIIDQIEAFSVAGEEVHGNILYVKETKAAIFKIEESVWLKQFNPYHLADCNHYQIMFYDEIYDIICRNISLGKGRMKIETA
jgi:hypothetical protein